ncbi:hypothetical protein NDU88_002661 [Pleurodeles waltl]|uniref:Uncharacterized protein n=1 Tax=Pleurodeles waltl TaxID=8319 RepID=A0AAV7WQK7_PLEWA|nr:hypothetical protein NDU88_002661 [Pleurodeles waltl]
MEFVLVSRFVNSAGFSLLDSVAQLSPWCSPSATRAVRASPVPLLLVSVAPPVPRYSTVRCVPPTDSAERSFGSQCKASSAVPLRDCSTAVPVYTTSRSDRGLPFTQTPQASVLPLI